MKNPLLLNWFATRLLCLWYGLYDDDATVTAAAAAAITYLSRTLVWLGYVCQCNSFHVKCTNFCVGRRSVETNARGKRTNPFAFFEKKILNAACRACIKRSAF